jgi:hypothetical protein
VPKRRSTGKALGSRRTRSAGKSTRKPSKQRVERPRAGGRLTEAGYWQWLRNKLRQASRQWWPIHDVMRAARRPTQSGDRRRKWDYLCAICGHWYDGRSVSVDHVIECGSLRGPEDVAGFVARLFCERDGLRVLCHTCHEERHAVGLD